jgi:hypothetical protein
MKVLNYHCSDCIHNNGVDNNILDCETFGKIKLEELATWETCAGQHWHDDSPHKKVAEERLKEYYDRKDNG